MSVLPALPTIDLDKTTNQRTYTNLDEWINNNISGKTYADRIKKITIFYQKNYGLTPLQMADDNIETIAKKLVEYLR